MKKLLISCLIIISLKVAAQDNDYTKGVFILNEDHFGFNNGSINFWDSANEIYYNVFRTENPVEGGGYGETKELGCTAQHGIIYGDKMIIMSKQDTESSSQADGGRVTIAEYPSLKCIKQMAMLETNPSTGKSMADGRACVGVNDSTAYLGSSNGIFVLNLKTYEIEKKIEGTENPLITGEENNANGLGPLYRNQIGLMIRGTDYVFAIYQDKGLLVIDPTKHKIIKIIYGCFSTMTMDIKGNIWIGENTNENPTYLEYPYGSSGSEWKGFRLLKINQHTLETSTITLANDKSKMIAQSWYAWTPGVLHADTREEILYWADPLTWFHGEKCQKIFKFDIATKELTVHFDAKIGGNKNQIYTGSGFGINPLNNHMYVFIQSGEVYDANFLLSRLDPDGNEITTKQLINHWWYPSMLIPADRYAPELSNNLPSSILINPENPLFKIYLGDKVTDKDNLSAAIVKSVRISDTSIVKAWVKADTLYAKANLGDPGTVTLSLRFNSNGKIITHTMSVQVANPSIVSGVSLNQHQITILKGDSIQLFSSIEPENALNPEVTWHSENETIATVSNDGWIKGVSYGNTSVIVTTIQNGLTDTCKIKIIEPLQTIVMSEYTQELEVNETSTLRATPMPLTAENRSLEWSSSNPDIVKVQPTPSTSGNTYEIAIVTALDTGQATIYATSSYMPHIKDSCIIQVGQSIVPISSVEISGESILYTGKTLQLTSTVLPPNATNPSVNWNTSDSSIATVDAYGLVTGIASGQVSITLTDKIGSHSDNHKLTILKSVGSLSLDTEAKMINRGNTFQLNATILPDDAYDKTIIWSSIDNQIATVTEGLVTATGEGTTFVIATSQSDSIYADTCKIIVTVAVESITLNPSARALTPGESVQITPIITPTDATNPLISWHSSDNAVATVSASGLVKATGKGEATITALVSGGIEAYCMITVTSNHNPIIANPIADIIVHENDAPTTISLANVFTDPDDDDDAITKTVKSNSNTELVNTYISENNLTLTYAENLGGEAEISIEATSNGKVVTDVFTVTVIANQAPTVVNPIADFEVKESANPSIISLINVFTDTDNDDNAITKTVKNNSNTNLVSASISNNTLTLTYTPSLAGEAQITIEALSNGKTVTDQFTVTVNADQAPVVINPISNISVLANAEPSIIPLENVFTDIDDDDNAITKNVKSNSNPDLVGTTISDNTLTLTYTANLIGEAEITIEATSNNKAVNNSFFVTVTQEGVLIVANPIADIFVKDNSEPTTISLVNVFTDPSVDDKDIVKTIKSNSNSELVSAAISDSILTLTYTANVVGYAEITIEATSNSKTITDSFTVTITEDQAPIVANPIADVDVFKNAEPTIISLVNVFTDVDDDDTTIIKTIKMNSNTELVTTNILNNELTLNYTPNTTGEAEIEVEAKSYGKTITDVFIVTVKNGLGVEDVSASNLTIYPNPVSGTFRIKFSNSENIRVHIYNTKGLLIYKKSNYTPMDKIDMSTQPSGQYVVKITQGKHVSSKIIIVK